ncbi:MAG TPA: 7-carboxy-7-deazaguanine synthase QueE, partial [Nitrosomonas europaea]|nr:7-carboxy-7-deazaguanine synthase QueE [Nitrosomonas europaea]
IVDIKTPGSGEVEKNHWNNLAYLTSHDEIKFVLCDRADYDWARQKLLELKLDVICPVLFSPAYGQLVPADLAAWILQDQLPVRLQLQLHKLLWGECVGR